MAEIIIKPLLYGVDFDSQTRELTFKRKDGAAIYSCTIPSQTLVDDVTKPLMFRAVEDNSSVTLNAVGNYAGTFKTSTDAHTWESYVMGTAISMNADDRVYFMVDNFVTKSASAHCQFVMTGTIEAWHNVNSMISSDFASLADLSSFGDYTLADLFRDCSVLVKAPLLPATTLVLRCYSHMFDGCTGLTQAPALPATTLANRCCQYMFQGCTSLTQAPALPATTLYDYCYQFMFAGCTSLVQAPVLSATTLANSCCQNMFSGCTGLTESPVLNATSLGASYAYSGMFRGCSNLCKVTDHSSGGVFNTTDNWLYGVAATGEFYCPSNAKWTVTGASGIPDGWTRHDL